MCACVGLCLCGCVVHTLMCTYMCAHVHVCIQCACTFSLQCICYANHAIDLVLAVVLQIAIYSVWFHLIAIINMHAWEFSKTGYCG